MEEYQKQWDEAKTVCQEFIDVMNSYDSREYYAIKCYLILNIWLWHADHFPTTEDVDPLPGFLAHFQTAIEVMEKLGKSGFNVNHYPETEKQPVDYEKNMGMIFRDIWVQMTDEIYFDQCFEFTKVRYEKNGVDPFHFFGGKVVVDAGCGAGKVTSTIAKFGAKKVLGYDLTEEGLEFAKKQSQKFPEGQNITYQYGKAYDLPLEDASVDVVHCNGVVHHTNNYEGCIAELSRILKPGGSMYLFVMGRSGLFEILADTISSVCKNIPQPFFIHYLQALGMNSGRIYWSTDHCYARYDWKSQKDLETMLQKHNFTELKQMVRGVGIDQIELIATNAPYIQLKYGEGQLKYIARKAA